jgi:hypothetical protein
MGLETEYAMTKTRHGAPVVRRDAVLSLLKGMKALLAQPGRRPPLDSNGESMLWNEKRGWFPRDSRSSPTIARRSSGRPLKKWEARQRSVGRQVRHDDRDAELRAERELIDGASANAWRWARMFSLESAGRAWMRRPTKETAGDSTTAVS